MNITSLRYVTLRAEADVHTTAGPVVFRSPSVPPDERWRVIHAAVSVWAADGEAMSVSGARLLPLGVPRAALTEDRPRFGAWRRSDGIVVPVEEEPLEAPEGWTFEVPISFDRDPQFAWRALVAIEVVVNGVGA